MSYKDRVAIIGVGETRCVRRLGIDLPVALKFEGASNALIDHRA